jgi:hypothetical protein
VGESRGGGFAGRSGSGLAREERGLVFLSLFFFVFLCLVLLHLGCFVLQGKSSTVMTLFYLPLLDGFAFQMGSLKS